ncbi:GNAT family N-acetyltransferase [Methylobacterium brachythecii]|uniref:GCN5 family N-acetyltransferase n=1 Tax=Methylobacterium brachythecii TaxID=1176177 RepID=A0A7W6APM5_9HYPH|nr:N-acetyltransferase [Methylobacterium brachythecii]MBB3904396.1 putative N-acetyltransferase YhbS [Methylobacterium brachythecii]GLS43675.1 GCN5 family N-acetyltransferase [Methylobacterium brachythecii]
MILIRHETASDIGARERLLDTCFGEGRYAKTSQRLREGRLPAGGLSLSAEDADGRLVGTVRLWHVEAGRGRPALLLGPLAVDPSIQGCGLGGGLMQAAVARAKKLGHAAVLLVGDAPYYERFGFSADKAAGLYMPGPFERERLLGLELETGALSGARGVLHATGAFEPLPGFAAETAAADARRQAA